MGFHFSLANQEADDKIWLCWNHEVNEVLVDVFEPCITVDLNSDLYGSQFDPTGPTRYSPSDWIEISFSESSPSEGSCSIGAPPVSNSSASEASTGIWDELTYYSPLDLNTNDMSQEFQNVCVFFQGKIEEIGVDLPSTWTLEGFTQLVLGEEEVFDPSYLSDVYSNLLECGFHSCYWEAAFEYIQLIYGIIYDYAALPLTVSGVQKVEQQQLTVYPTLDQQADWNQSDRAYPNQRKIKEVKTEFHNSYERPLQDGQFKLRPGKTLDKGETWQTDD
ncbi:hypothetical protein L3X38_017106 [Prunus dulcis]|uniref:Uncharacterized protein n=1 Tax=Prunus dulcis TaxID=3755 RepID=A0AAD4W6I1_PRUDU|nr:hypothetical protein L3X38_017106 [Prunus dulcis]